MAKKGFEYLDSPQKRQLERAARYAFMLIAMPKACAFEKQAKADLGISGDGIYRSERIGQYGRPFTFIKSQSLKSDHPDAKITNGAFNAAATAFTQQGRNTACDEWRQYLNLFGRRDRSNPLRRNYLKQGELWVVSSHRPETAADIAQLQRIGHVPESRLDNILLARTYFRPGAACESAAWRHQFEDGRHDLVVATSLGMEEHYLQTATFDGDLEFMRTIHPRLADMSSDMVGKDPVAIQERIMATIDHPRYKQIDFGEQLVAA